MSVPTCIYLKPDGTGCNSPALRGKRFCYFHLDPDSRRLKAAWARAIVSLRVAKARERTFAGRFLGGRNSNECTILPATPLDGIFYAESR